MTGPIRTAARVAWASTPALANVGTALTSLVAVPLLGVVLLVAITLAAGAGPDAAVATAYAGVVVAFGAAIVSGTVAQVTTDRQIGVLADVLVGRPVHPAYWISKVSVPVLTGTAVAMGALLALGAVVPASRSLLVGALVVLPVVAVAGACSAVAAATLSIGLKDPYLISNVVVALVPLSAGVVVPVVDYPDALRFLASALPFTASIEALRAIGDASAVPWSSVAVLAVRELVVCGAWLLCGLAASRFVVAALRSGRRSEEIW